MDGAMHESMSEAQALSGPRYRVEPGDFYVEERPRFELSEDGDHDYLWVEKVGLTTEQVAAALARDLGMKVRDVGFAGRKDRWARTRQWFSVRDADGGRAKRPEGDGYEVLDVAKGRRKLRPGDLEGNLFVIRVRDVSPGEWRVVEGRVERLARLGFANRFGRQRFGHDGDNARSGRDILLGERRIKDRRRARFLIAALQAELFNLALDLRERAVHVDADGRRAVDQVVSGDLLVSHATGLCLRADGSEEQQELVDALELSPSGPMFGAKMMRPGGLTRQLESEALQQSRIDEHVWQGRKARFDVTGERRSLRCPVFGLSGRYVPLHESEPSAESGGSVVLEFELPAGSYATVLLEEAFAGLGLTEARGGTAKEGAKKRS